MGEPRVSPHREGASPSSTLRGYGRRRDGSGLTGLRMVLPIRGLGRCASDMNEWGGHGGGPRAESQGRSRAAGELEGHGQLSASLSDAGGPGLSAPAGARRTPAGGPA